MSQRTQHRLEAGCIAVFFAALSIFWMGSRAVSRTASADIRCFGGSLSLEKQILLETMTHELSHAERVLSISSRRILFQDRNHQLKEYRFLHPILWCDRGDAMSGVNDFHFTYRDAAGNLLTNRPDNCDRIKTIEYIVRFNEDGTEIIARSSATLQQPDTDVEGSLSGQFASMDDKNP
jgi:hypothetical protein